MSGPDDRRQGDIPLQPALGTWEAIDSLRVVRRFSDRTLEPWVVERIVDAGRRTGSSKNLQRWAFIVCRDRVHLGELATLGPWAAHLAGAAVAIALVTPDPRTQDAPLSVTWDLGRAAQSMVLAAWELGVGSVPATVYEHDRARQLLEFTQEPVSAIARQVGFENPFYFTLRFRRHLGASPREWRQQQAGRS